MCGIVGMIAAYNNGFTSIEADAFETMLFLDLLRGKDSTGVFGVNYHNNVAIHKKAVHSLDFLNTDEFQNFRTKMIREGMFVVGHNRAATRGNVTDKNAHPFWEEDKIVMVHNGTWRGSHHKHKNTEVDSEVICHLLATHDSVEEALQKVDAAYALAWYNVKEKSLNFIRNHERPLYRGVTKEKAILYCSEPATIAYACARSGLVLTAKPEEVEVGVLHKYVLDQEKKEYEFTMTKLDCSFRPAVRPYVQLAGVSANDDDGELGLGGWEGGMGGRYMRPPFPNAHNVYTVPSRRHQRASRKENTVYGPADIKKAFSTIVSETIPEIFLPNEEAMELAKEVATKYVDKQAIIELEDYHPANDHVDCTCFFVSGTLVMPTDADYHMVQKVKCYWIMHGMYELELCNLIGDGNLYMGTLCHPVVMSTLTKEGDRKSFVISFVRNPEVIVTEEGIEVNTLVH